MSAPVRYNVLGVGVHALDLPTARELVLAGATDATRGYVCCCDVNSVSAARRDPAHRTILNNSLLTTPDGMPIVWLGRRAGHTNVKRVYGPDLLLAIAAATASGPRQAQAGRHYFYGAGAGTAAQLARELVRRFPGLNVVGTGTPPFTPMGDEAIAGLAQELRAARPDFIWVGLSTPKQEALMARLLPWLDSGVMLGVGAAFDLLSGRVRQAPRWLRQGGGEWLWRLALEPRRLGPRYAKNIPTFLMRVLAQRSGLRKYPLE